MRKYCYLLPLLLVVGGCSPLKTSLHDEHHQWELTVHEVQTNLDDVRHDINCFQAELQILDGRIKYFENALASLKQGDLEKQQAKIDQVSQQLHLLEKKWASFEKNQVGDKEGLDRLTAHANETSLALAQFKGRIEELEQEIASQNRHLETLSSVKGNLETLARSLKGEKGEIYVVRPGDSLEKIAKAHKTSVDQLKKLNHIDRDLIRVGQELTIPSE